MILLDTNVVSAFRERRVAPDPHFAAWATATSGETTYLSVITVFELERGVERLARRDPAQAAMLRDWLDRGILPRFTDRILPVDQRVAAVCARLHVEATRPELDAMIAATALVHDLTIATRNVRDFADTGVRLINPWAYRVGIGSGPE